MAELRGCLSNSVHDTWRREAGILLVFQLPTFQMERLDESDQEQNYRIKIKARGVGCLVRIRYT